MEFTCEKKELQGGVSTVEKIVATRSALPIIANILIEAGKNGVKLSANNLEMGIELHIKADVTKEGSLLLPAKTLSGIVSKLPDAKIGFKLNENHTVRIAYEKSGFNLHSLPADEFPALPKVKDGKSITIESKIFVAMIRQVIFSVSTSEDKYSLTGVLLETGKSQIAGDTTNIRLVATDGYRLAKKGAKVPAGIENGINVIVPAKALMEIAKILDNSKTDSLKITVSAEQIIFNYGGGFLVSRVIQGQFPDYKQVIPKKGTTKVTLLTDDFFAATERAAVIASGSANVSCFELKAGKMHISANTPDVGSIDEVLEAEVSGGDKAKVSFNIRLVTDVLSVVDSDRVVVELGEGLSPGVIRPVDDEDYLYLIMPIRTQEGA